MIPRLRVVAAAAVLAVAAGAVALTSVSSADTSVPAPARVAPANLRTTLVDETAPDPGGLVRWTTRWELRWDPVPDAVSYVLTAVGPEGEATRPIRTVDRPEFSLSVAAGTTTEATRLSNRDAQAAYRATQLGVAVAAVYPDGTTGPRTPVVPVGSTLR